jgi:hypothetical protein
MIDQFLTVIAALTSLMLPRHTVETCKILTRILRKIHTIRILHYLLTEFVINLAADPSNRICTISAQYLRVISVVRNLQKFADHICTISAQDLRIISVVRNLQKSADHIYTRSLQFLHATSVERILCQFAHELCKSLYRLQLREESASR